MKKRLISLLLTITLCTFSTLVFAETKEINKEANITKLKIKQISVTVPYNSSKIKVERILKDGFERIEIKDKNTGEILEAYGEKVEYVNNQQQTKDIKNVNDTENINQTYDEVLDTYNKSFNLIQSTSRNNYYSLHTIYKERKDGPAVTRLYTVVKLYSYGSFRQIESIENTYWTEESSGNWELQNPQASSISTSGKFPTIEIETSGTATITVTTTSSVTGEFSISALKSVGYTVSATWFYLLLKKKY